MTRVLGVLLLLCASLSWGQARVEDGGHEIQLWTGGGHSVSGGTRIPECGMPGCAMDGF